MPRRELDSRGKLIVFLLILAIFTWPGYQAFSAVVSPAGADRPAQATAREEAEREPMSTPVAQTTSSIAQSSRASATEVAAAHDSTDTSANVSKPPSRATATLVPTNTAIPSATPLPTRLPVPHLRHIDEKLYILDLINVERRRSGVSDVQLGDNNAAQMHAESSLEGCYSSHWGSDGLKPYMRYSLAGGYQSNGENNSGSDYCVRAADGYTALSGLKTEIRETMTGWMNSPGHRRNIVEKNHKHKKVNIGLMWDRYNLVVLVRAMYELGIKPLFTGGDASEPQRFLPPSIAWE